MSMLFTYGHFSSSDPLIHLARSKGVWSWAAERERGEREREFGSFPQCQFSRDFSGRIMGVLTERLFSLGNKAADNGYINELPNVV